VPLPVRWPDAGAALSDQEILFLYGAGYAGLRSRFSDDYLRDACSAGARQVVVLAAGLDTRAFRLGLPDGVRLFELDQPKVLEFKDAVLRENGATARCARAAVGVDLREDWATAPRDSGFDAGAPTAWLATHGWAVADEPVTAVAERYHRNLADPGLPRPSSLPAAPASQAAGPSVQTSSLSARRAR
jgi:Leucine carboxyl methyltransferase